MILKNFSKSELLSLPFYLSYNVIHFNYYFVVIRHFNFLIGLNFRIYLLIPLYCILKVNINTNPWLLYFQYAVNYLNLSCLPFLTYRRVMKDWIRTYFGLLTFFRTQTSDQKKSPKSIILLKPSRILLQWDS